MTQITVFVLAILCFVFVIFGIDDAFIDVIAWFRGLGPRELSIENLQEIHRLGEQRVAIMIAAWKEAEVLRAMIRGNIARLCYSNYEIFVGVYPNDAATWSEAADAAREFSKVTVVVNRQPGPTSKGQMLNEIVREIHRCEREKGYDFDLFVIHDSEDVIHPLELKLVNWRTRFVDFVQTPVFSFATPQLQFVSGLYLDEFAESHTKDLLVREYFNAPIPSAGVGTAMTRRFVRRARREQALDLFNPKTVTEDYQLGLMAHRLKCQSEFACYFVKTSGGARDYVATREYFPRTALASVRQKSRWILGIAFQGTEALGWNGSLAHRYFLYRDRKSPVTHALTFCSFAAAFLVILRPDVRQEVSEALVGLHLGTLVTVNLVFMSNRLFQRGASTVRVYGWGALSMMVPRMLVGNIINALASFRATYQYGRYYFSGVVPAWLKTSHELPQDFGKSSEPLVQRTAL